MSGERKNVFGYGEQGSEVTWDRRLCIHVGECGRADNELFVSGRDPWCDPTQVSTQDALEVVTRCPTGSLAMGADAAIEEAAEGENVIVISNDGPIYLRGQLNIDGAADDMPGVRFRAALCRCGHSKNKPFCDNSHRGEFKDAGAVGGAGEAIEDKGGELEVRALPDGPLLLNGNMTIVTGAGREAWTGTKAALCRCGHSKNKPFCDGAHRAAGFEAP